MAEQEQDRTEQATPFKLREAKRRGQVAKSLELNSLFAIGGLITVMSLWGERMVARHLAVDRLVFEQAAQVNFALPQLLAWIEAITIEMLWMLSPLFLVALLLAVLGNLVQTGPIFTFFPLKPDVQRLNPVAGFKRLFSLRLLFESVKTILKLIFFGMTLFFVVKALMPKMLTLLDVNPEAYPPLLLQDVISLVFKLLMAIFLVAILDVVYTRWDYGKKQRMSRREVKDEVKRREGDPQVRARIRELQREAVKRSKALRRVPDADVLITNPQHFAVALLYRRGEMAAPQVIAKGAGDLAQNMKEIARRHRVPIVENKPLARALFREGAIDKLIPESCYPGVARVLAVVYAARRPDEGAAVC